MIVTCTLVDYVRGERTTVMLDDDDFAKVEAYSMLPEDMRDVVSLTLAQDLPLEEKMGTVQFAICAFILRLKEKERITIEHLKVYRVPGKDRVDLDLQAALAD